MITQVVQYIYQNSKYFPISATYNLENIHHFKEVIHIPVTPKGTEIQGEKECVLLLTNQYFAK